MEEESPHLSVTFSWNLALPTGSCRQNEKCQHSAPSGKIALRSGAKGKGAPFFCLCQSGAEFPSHDFRGRREYVSLKCQTCYYYQTLIDFSVNFICCVSLGPFPETLNCCFCFYIIFTSFIGEQVYGVCHVIMLPFTIFKPSKNQEWV